MATETSSTAYTDEQLADVRFAIEKMNEIRCERDNIVLGASLEIAGGKQITIAYDRERDQFVADL